MLIEILPSDSVNSVDVDDVHSAPASDVANWDERIATAHFFFSFGFLFPFFFIGFMIGNSLSAH